MKDKYKLALIYFILFIPTVLLGSLLKSSLQHYNESSWIILLVNAILFLTLTKVLKINSAIVSKFLLIILVLFIILIIDKDLFYSSFTQSTPTLIFPVSFLALINLFLLPFIPIFHILYSLNIFNLSFIVIPFYIITLMFINRKLESLNKH